MPGLRAPGRWAAPLPLTGRAPRFRAVVPVAVGVAAALALTAQAVPAAGAAGAAVPVLLVQAGQPGPAVSPLLNGVNHRWDLNGNGVWDAAADRPVSLAAERTARAGVSLVRYPGGTVANLFDWKKAIGPTGERGCQLNGRPTGVPLDSAYGPDEHMEFAAAVGAEAQIMVPFANETPGDAADWVEYMNAEVGSNPRGGVAWADVRARNGHPEPYGVKHWEIGNEHDREGNQRYWLDRHDTERAMRQYAFGGTQRQDHTEVGEQVGKGCDFRTAVASDGTPGQVFRVRFAPVVPGSATVWVGGEQWTEVADLAGAAAGDKVYSMDADTGEISFGDGSHGAIPPDGADVAADYDSGPHPGFVDFHAEMKKADPDIEVCSAWGELEFVAMMAEAGHGDDYDCLAVHPYTNFERDFDGHWTGAAEAYEQHMLGEQVQGRRVADLIDATRAHEAPAFVEVSEFGALFLSGGPNNGQQAVPGWSASMMHTVYMASQLTRFANLGIRFAEGNDLVGPERGIGSRTLLSGAPEFLYTTEAVMREQLGPVLAGGGHAVGNRIRNNPSIATTPSELGSAYQALMMTATVSGDGVLNIVVVNRDPDSAVSALVAPGGFEHASTARVTTVAGEDVTSVNSPENPDAVGIDASDVPVGDSDFRYEFGAHSVTVIRLAPR